jgi:fluoride ion exporter CrcB/FEX
VTTLAVKKNEPWWRHKANLLLAFGMGIIIAEFIAAEIFGRPFHAEWLILAGGFCGAWTTQLGDRK